jgi:hypothetical protein
MINIDDNEFHYKWTIEYYVLASSNAVALQLEL